jgi:hypothetical protein
VRSQGRIGGGISSLTNGIRSGFRALAGTGQWQARASVLAFGNIHDFRPD